MNYIALDFEVANNDRSSVISVGAVPVVDGVIRTDQSFYSLIYPGDIIFEPIHYSKHRLTPKDLESAPTFKELWNNKLKNMLSEKIVVIHNTSMDIAVIRKCIEAYELESVAFDYVCTMNSAKQMNINVERYRLEDLCKYYSIETEGHHNALHDAIMTAELALKMFDNSPMRLNIYKQSFISSQKSHFNSESDFKNSDSIRVGFNFGQKIKGDVLKKDTTEKADNPFNNKKVVVSGTYENWPDRIKLAELMKRLGADVDISVTEKTNFLIAGKDVGPSKCSKMQRNIENGKDANIINEAQLLQLLDGVLLEQTTDDVFIREKKITIQNGMLYFEETSRYIPDPRMEKIMYDINTARGLELSAPQDAVFIYEEIIRNETDPPKAVFERLEIVYRKMKNYENEMRTCVLELENLRSNPDREEASSFRISEVTKRFEIAKKLLLK